MSKVALAPLIRKIETVFTLTNDEAKAIAALPVRIQQFAKGGVIVQEGDRPTQSFAVISGITCMFKHSSEGHRQILIFHFKGDMPDLQSLHLNVLDMSVAAVTPVKLGFIQHEDIRQLYRRFPRIGDVLWRDALITSAILREWMMVLGQRDAYAKLAHFLCEMAVRMKLAGLDEDGTYAFPITQQEIGDAIGLSHIHVNRMAQILKEKGLVEMKRGKLLVREWSKLCKAATFDPTYLHLTPAQKNLLAL
jgi:CRP-like cAMP-binding protein